MRCFPNKLFLVILATFYLTGCGDLSKEVENKLDELSKKTESLDSMINKEVDKVLALDSLIIGESDKVKKLDSIIDKNTARLDSIVNEKGKIFK